MGLLDDAIREHLEFKLQRGADPQEVSRQEREALGPVEREGHSQAPSPAVAVQVSVDEAERGRGSAKLVAPPGDESDPERAQYTGEETAEIDMSTVLEAERSARASAPGPEESLEWEMPAATKANLPQGDGGEAVEDEQAEDVLEETPDFLRESPDQERLWFEQHPPRDFDFDK